MQTVAVQAPGGAREIDTKKYAKVEKLPGGSIEDCKVLAGASPGGARRRAQRRPRAAWPRGRRGRRATRRCTRSPYDFTILNL